MQVKENPSSPSLDNHGGPTTGTQVGNHGSDDIKFDDDGIPTGKSGLIQEIPTSALLLAIVPLSVLAAICLWMELLEISTSLLVGCCRTLVQLTILGSMLKPIFLLRSTKQTAWVVVGYAVVMVLLASYETSSRTKYTFHGQFLCVLASLLTNVGWVSFFAFSVILHPPEGRWHVNMNPRYVIPIVGMLLGNSIHGVSLSLDALTKGMVEQSDEIELYLSFGATKWEAVSRILKEAIKQGMSPILNTMRVIGIISIPGTMTGQILGGSPAQTAARYQMLIIFLIAMSTMGVILMNSILAVEAGFDSSHHALRPGRFVKNNRMRVSGMIVWLLMTAMESSYNSLAWMGNVTTMPSSDMNTTVPVANAKNSYSTDSRGNLDIRSLKESCSGTMKGQRRLEAVGLSRSFDDPLMVNEVGDVNLVSKNRRVLFENISLAVGVGDLLLVSGPSGVGKSTLLRMVAGLSPLQDDECADSVNLEGSYMGLMHLAGKNWHEDYAGGTMSATWRKEVRYITQSKIRIPGTPHDFMDRITSFHSWSRSGNGPSSTELTQDTRAYILQWGLGIDALDKEWSLLSGGEAQRVIVALALASRPSILLFDESTSSLDATSKIAVENSVKDYIHEQKGGACWISHDAQQAERMGTFENAAACSVNGGS